MRIKNVPMPFIGVTTNWGNIKGHWKDPEEYAWTTYSGFSWTRAHDIALYVQMVTCSND